MIETEQGEVWLKKGNLQLRLSPLLKFALDAQLGGHGVHR